MAFTLIQRIREARRGLPEECIREPVDDDITFIAFLHEVTVQYIIARDLPPPYGRHFMDKYFEPITAAEEKDLAAYIDGARAELQRPPQVPGHD